MNSVPHIGHAFEFILGDAITKWIRISPTSCHNETYFNIGLDEHGLKVWEKSQELGITPEEHIKNLTVLWKDFCQKFDIQYNTFYKTSDKSHHEKVKIIWDKFLKAGDIYKKSYSGNYCVGCESFKLDKEIVDNRCIDHPSSELKIVQEENYFFKLSKYKDILFDWITKNPNFLEPQSKLDELKNLITGSDDISISRLKENCPWGISVPNDDEQVIYVWFDALLNYIFAAGYLTDDFKWDNVIQLCGPDNLRFQAIIFQSFLEAEGIKKSDKLLVHGTIVDKDGRKISKSLGNVIDPIDQLEKFGINPVRYYALAGSNNYSNFSWDEEELKRLWNSEIVNDWGNLIARVLHLVDIRGGVNYGLCQDWFNDIINKYKDEIVSLWDNFKVKEALTQTNQLVKFANKYINEVQPWKSETYEVELINLLTLIKTVNSLYIPVFVDKCTDVRNSIESENPKKQILFDKI